MDHWGPKHVEAPNIMNKLNHKTLCIWLIYMYIARYWYFTYTGRHESSLWKTFLKKKKDLLKISGLMEIRSHEYQIGLLSLGPCLGCLKCGSHISSSCPSPLTAPKLRRFRITFPAKSEIFVFLITFRPAAGRTQAEGLKRVELHLSLSTGTSVRY